MNICELHPTSNVGVVIVKIIQTKQKSFGHIIARNNLHYKPSCTSLVILIFIPMKHILNEKVSITK